MKVISGIFADGVESKADRIPPAILRFWKYGCPLRLREVIGAAGPWNRQKTGMSL
jgi:hypothetical protein